MSLFHVMTQAAIATIPVAAAPQPGVTSYGAAFFANQQPGTALDMLNRIPGFTLDTGASVRGFEGAAGNVLIDGQRPASKSDSLQDILQRVPAGKVERIDVIRGGAPGVDMQGKAVLANLVLKKDDGLRALVSLADNRIDDGRDLGQVRAEASGTLGDVKWEVSGRAGRGLDDGAGAGKGVRFTPGQPPALTGYDGEGDSLFWNGVAAGEGPVLGGTLRVNGRLNTNDFKAEEFTRILTAPTANERSVLIEDTDETEIGARYSRKFGERLEMQFVGLRQTRDRVRDDIFTDADVSRFLVDRRTTEMIARAVAKYQANARWSFELGGESAINTLDSATTRSRNGVFTAVPAGNVGVQEDRSELFLKSTWRPAPKWTVDGGLRYEVSTLTADGDVVLEKALRYLKPRVAISWAPRPATQLRVRLEREVGQLNFNDFVASGGLNSAGGVTAGNPDLNPEQAWVGEVAIEQGFWTSGSLVLTYHHANLSDVVDRGPVTTSAGTFDRPENIGAGMRDVLSLDFTLPFDRLGLKGALLKGGVKKRWIEVTDPTTGQTRFQSSAHRLDWNATFTYDMPVQKITWGVEVFGAFRESYYRFNLVEEFKLSSYVKPFIEYRPRPDINIRLELPNVTRRNLHDIYYVYPRRRTAGAAPSFIDDRRTNATAGGAFLRMRKTFG